MRSFSVALLVASVFLDWGCPASSRTYQPLDWEGPLLKSSEKLVMPSDARANPSKYSGMQIHWVGVIDTLLLSPQGANVLASLVVDQKYYDYVEDFGPQHERMFVSPYGEGKFLFDKIFLNTGMDSVKVKFRNFPSNGTLAFCYGTFSAIRDSLPVLTAINARFVPSERFATDIFSYRAKRDSLGNIISDERGFPDLMDFKILRVH